MSERRTESLESTLRRHYAKQRMDADGETIDTLAATMVVECERVRRTVIADAGALAFVDAQVRYVPVWTWVFQALIVALMVAIARQSGNATFARVAVGALSACSVLVAVPTVHASGWNGMAELEYTCRHNAAAVAVARMIVLGCTCTLAVSVMVIFTALTLGDSALSVALWAAVPFFASCAGSLACARHAAPDSAALACTAWTLVCCGSLFVLGLACPAAYGAGTTLVWAIASELALLWLAREVARTIRAAFAGLDLFVPQVANTYN